MREVRERLISGQQGASSTASKPAVSSSSLLNEAIEEGLRQRKNLRQTCSSDSLPPSVSALPSRDSSSTEVGALVPSSSELSRPYSKKSARNSAASTSCSAGVCTSSNEGKEVSKEASSVSLTSSEASGSSTTSSRRLRSKTLDEVAKKVWGADEMPLKERIERMIEGLTAENAGEYMGRIDAAV